MGHPDSLTVNLTGMYLRLLLWFQGNRKARSEAFEQLKAAARLDIAPEERGPLKAILQMRSEFDHSAERIAIHDYGTGASAARGKGSGIHERSISSIHRTSSIPHWWGVFLFRLVRTLKPLKVLELGANLGVSGAYLQTALDLNAMKGHLVTIEGDPSLAAIARTTLESVSKGKADVITGRFQDQLGAALERCSTVDMAFLDGHHEYEATMRYFETIQPSLSPNACVVFDDVYLWSRPVRRAWKEIVSRNPSAVAVDFAKLGVLLFQEGAKN